MIDLRARNIAVEIKRVSPLPRGQRRKAEDERLIEEIKHNPDKLAELARELGQNDPTEES